MQDYWVRQAIDKPLFPDLMWSRPETKSTSGKLLIVGGNAHGFSAAHEAFSEAGKIGIGTARVLMPDVLQKTLGKVIEAGVFAPSSPSGSFSKQAIAELLALSEWADGVLLAGNLGRNSETAVLLEEFIRKYEGQLTITQDALDYFVKSPLQLLNRDNTLIVASFAQLQTLAKQAGFIQAFTFDMDLLRLVEALHGFSLQHRAFLVVKHLKNILVAVHGSISSTALIEDKEIWRVGTSAHAATWWLQNTGKSFEAITTSIIRQP